MSELDIDPGDTCDLCGSKAYVKVFITLDGLFLTFCGHCFNARQTALSHHPTVDHRNRIGR